MRRLGHLVWITLAAGGCLGGYNQGSPGTPGTPGTPGVDASAPAMTARQLFDAEVAPVLGGSCATCHAGTPPTTGPTFLGAGGSSYYGALLADPRFVNNDPQDSLLLTKGAHEGPGLTVGQGNAIGAWLAQEVVERGASLPPPPTTSTDQAANELQKFANCMALTDFNSSGMTDVHNQQVQGGDNCASCHSTGAYVLLGNDTDATFAALKTMPYLLKLAVAATNPDGSFKDVIASNRFIDRGLELGHPQFQMSGNRKTAISDFFTLTYTKYKAGSCSTSPPDGGL